MDGFRQKCCPFIISEDATAASVHLDVVKRNGMYLVYGMNGGVATVMGVDDLIPKINERGFAKSFYEYMAISSAPSGLYLPLQVLAIDNTVKTINNGVITEQQQQIDRQLATQGGYSIAHVGDGASAYRCVLQ